MERTHKPESPTPHILLRLQRIKHSVGCRNARVSCKQTQTRVGGLRACGIRFLFLDELKLIPLVLGPDPLFPQQPAGEGYRTLLVFTLVPFK